MRWIGIFIVSPLWGMISAQLLLQAWLAFTNGIISIVGFFAGRVNRKTTALGIGVGIGSVILFALLLRGGRWLLTDILSFGFSTAENTVYWVFVALSALYMLPQIPSRIKKSWRNAMVPGSFEDGIVTREVSKIISKKSDDADAYYNRGCDCASKGDDNNAIENFTKALELVPYHYHAYNNRGRAYANKGDHNKAIEDYTKAIELKSDDAMVYNNRGLAYSKKGENNKAEDDFKKYKNLLQK